MEILGILPVIIIPLLGAIRFLRKSRTFHNLIRVISMNIIRRMTRTKQSKVQVEEEKESQTPPGSPITPPPSSPMKKKVNLQEILENQISIRKTQIEIVTCLNQHREGTLKMAQYMDGTRLFCLFILLVQIPMFYFIISRK